MGRKGRLTLLGAVAASAAAVTRPVRQRVLSSLFGFPAPRYAVEVTRGIEIPMPDGTVQLADHYRPTTGGPYPTILQRTPYGRGYEARPWTVQNPPTGAAFAAQGYNVIFASTRGRFGSGGTFRAFQDQRQDGLDTIAWIEDQPWFDGSIGLFGASFCGYTQWAVASDAPASVKAMVPMVCPSRFYDLVYESGAFSLETFLLWAWIQESVWSTTEHVQETTTFEMLKRVSPKGQHGALDRAAGHLPLEDAAEILVGERVPYYEDWLAHTEPDDYWASVDEPHGPSGTTVPAHITGSWYDLLLTQTLADYRTLRDRGQDAQLTIGPWIHSSFRGYGEYTKQALAWYDAHLKGESGRRRTAPVRAYVLGAKEWRDLEDWPPPSTSTRWYVTDGGLAPDPPTRPSEPDAYRYDPADPTPSWGGPTLGAGPNGPVDNAELEARDDVLVYTSAPLASDLEVIGHVALDLFVRSDIGHADYFARLCDVDPRGKSTNICDALQRFTPDDGEAQPDGSRRVEVGLWATAHRFKAGHRLRLCIASGAHPRWNRNSGTGDPDGKATRLVPSSHEVFHDAEHPTSLILPVTTA